MILTNKKNCYDQFTVGCSHIMKITQHSSLAGVETVKPPLAEADELSCATSHRLDEASDHKLRTGRVKWSAFSVKSFE